MWLHVPGLLEDAMTTPNPLTPNEVVDHLLTVVEHINNDLDDMEDRIESLSSTIDNMRDIANV